jgi:hypothetical protein
MEKSEVLSSPLFDIEQDNRSNTLELATEKTNS